MPHQMQQTMALLGWAKSPDDLKDTLGDAGVQWIDIRDDDEIEKVRIPDCDCIPMADVLDRAAEIDRAKDVVVVCLSGARSAAVTFQLRERGFDNVYNLTGGIAAWVRAGLPVERNTPTL